jgi:hypothetical protein
MRKPIPVARPTSAALLALAENTTAPSIPMKAKTMTPKPALTCCQAPAWAPEEARMREKGSPIKTGRNQAMDAMATTRSGMILSIVISTLIMPAVFSPLRISTTYAHSKKLEKMKTAHLFLAKSGT